MTRNLVLFGMMGAGKTTVAEVVAQRLERDAVDTDREVERAAGRSIAEIFSTEGQAAFRRHERAVIEYVAQRGDLVVSVGGGAVLDDQNVEHLRSSGVLVELRAPVEVLTARLERALPAVGEPALSRPLLRGGSLPARVADLARARRGAYDAVADHRVDASGEVADVAEAILTWASTAPGVLSAAEVERVAP